MKTNKIKTVVYEILMIDRDLIDYIKDKDDYFILLEKEREEKVNELINMFNTEGE